MQKERGKGNEMAYSMIRVEPYAVSRKPDARLRYSITVIASPEPLLIILVVVLPVKKRSL